MFDIGNIVEEFTLGETKICICDDYCRDRTKEEIDMILENISKAALLYLQIKGS